MKNGLTNDYYLERFVLGELPEEDSRKIQELISQNETLRKKIEELEASNLETLELYHPSVVAAQIRKRLTKNSHEPLLKRVFSRIHPARRLIYASSVLISIAVILLLIRPGGDAPVLTLPFDADSDLTLVKGVSEIDFSSTQLLIFRKNNDTVDILQNGNHARNGDLLQLAYITVQEKYGMIISLDGRGRITLHYPAGLNSESTELEMNKKAFLPNAIELDDAPHFERFLFITSDSPIDVAQILKQAKKIASDPAQAGKVELDLPKNFNQYSVLIIKGEES